MMKLMDVITEENKNTKKRKRSYNINEKIEGLKKKAEKSGISYGILKKVYDRGMGAYKTSHRPGTTPQQWAFARVNSFISKGKGTWGRADSDLASKAKKAKKAKGSKKKNESVAQVSEISENDLLLQNVEKLKRIHIIHEAIDWHKDNQVPLTENVFRVGSKMYFELYCEARKLYKEGKLELTGLDKSLIEDTDIGSMAINEEGKLVPLDCPMIKEENKKDVEIGKPKRGGSKKFYVYVRKPDGGIKKVTWGDTTGLAVKLKDPKARKSFAARHKCSTKKDRTKASYWACNTPRYAKQLGLSGGGNFYW